MECFRVVMADEGLERYWNIFWACSCKTGSGFGSPFAGNNSATAIAMALAIRSTKSIPGAI